MIAHKLPFALLELRWNWIPDKLEWCSR